MKLFIASLCLLLLLGHSCRGDDKLKSAAEDQEQNEVDAPKAEALTDLRPPSGMITPPSSDDDSQDASSIVLPVRQLPDARTQPSRRRHPQSVLHSRLLGQYPRRRIRVDPRRRGLPTSHRQQVPLQGIYGVVPPYSAPRTLYTTNRYYYPQLSAADPEHSVPFRGSVRPLNPSSRLPDSAAPPASLPHPFTPFSAPSRPLTPSSPLPRPLTPIVTPFPTYPDSLRPDVPSVSLPDPVTPTTPEKTFIESVDVRTTGVFPSDTFPLDPNGPFVKPSGQVENSNDGLVNPAVRPNPFTYHRDLFRNPRVVLPAQGNNPFLTHDMRPSSSIIRHYYPSFVNYRGSFVNPPSFTNQDNSLVNEGVRDDGVLNQHTPIVDRDGTIVNQGVSSFANQYLPFADRDTHLPHPVAPSFAGRDEDFINRGQSIANQGVQSLDNGHAAGYRDTTFASQGVYPFGHPSANPVTPSDDTNGVLVNPAFQYLPQSSLVSAGGSYGNYYRQSYNYGY